MIDGSRFPLSVQNEFREARAYARSFRYVNQTVEECLKRMSDCFSVGTRLKYAKKISIFIDAKRTQLSQFANAHVMGFSQRSGSKQRVKEMDVSFEQNSLSTSPVMTSLSPRSAVLNQFVRPDTPLTLEEAEGNGFLMKLLSPTARVLPIKERVSLLKEVVSLGADMDFEKEDGYDPFTYLLSDQAFGVPVSERIELLNVLVAAGADLNDQESREEIPLIYILSRSNSSMSVDEQIELIKALIAAGSDVNCQNNNGDMPLTSLLSNDGISVDKQIEIINILVNSGADVNFSNKGTTPIGYLLQKEWPLCTAIALLRELIRLGAKINAPCLMEGGTPLYYAHGQASRQALIALGASQAMVDSVVLLKNLAHAWGLKGFGSYRETISEETYTARLKLESNGEEKATEFFYSMVDLFSTQLVVEKYRKAWGEVTRWLVASAQELTAFSRTANKTLTEISAWYSQFGKDDLRVFVSGWKGHSVVLVIYGTILCICNRGARRAESGVEIRSFNRDNPQQFACFISKILRKAKNQDEFQKNLSLIPSAFVDRIQQHPQKAATCTFTSRESSVLTLLYAASYLGFGIQASEAIILYKMFTGFVRKTLLNQYLGEQWLDRTVLTQIYGKIDQDVSHFTEQEKKELQEKILKTME